MLPSRLRLHWQVAFNGSPKAYKQRPTLGSRGWLISFHFACLRGKPQAGILGLTLNISERHKLTTKTCILVAGREGPAGGR